MYNKLALSLFCSSLSVLFVLMAFERYQLAVFASGRGANAERLFIRFAGHASISVALLVSSSSRARVLDKATTFAVPTYVATADKWECPEGVLQILAEHGITHLVLAGFLWLLPAPIVRAYRDRIINIHPSLLPRYGGKGMYGMHVHRAVKQAGEKETGITIHLVNEYYDDGEIIFQARCQVDSADTAEDIAGNVQRLEHKYYAPIVERWVRKWDM